MSNSKLSEVALGEKMRAHKKYLLYITADNRLSLDTNFRLLHKDIY